MSLQPNKLEKFYKHQYTQETRQQRQEEYNNQQRDLRVESEVKEEVKQLRIKKTT